MRPGEAIRARIKLKPTAHERVERRAGVKAGMVAFTADE